MNDNTENNTRPASPLEHLVSLLDANMQDRELLELAAKAANMIPKDFIGNQNYMDGLPSYWNPLTDDGDALRLAVKLGMEIRIDESAQMVSANTALWTDTGYCEGYGEDAITATRRAIVRAAAEIGKQANT